MKFSEYFLGIALIISLILKIKGYENGEFFLALSTCLLSLFYFTFGFFLINKIKLRNILKKSAYKNISTIQIIIGILGGIILAIQIFGMLFIILSLSGAQFLLLIGLILGACILFLIFLQYITKSKISYKPLFYRVLLFFIVLSFLRSGILDIKPSSIEADPILSRLSEIEYDSNDSTVARVIKGQKKRMENEKFKEGEMITFYDNGDTASVINYERDSLNGSYKIYGFNNRLFEKGNFNKGKPTGIYKQFYDNGKLKIYKYYDPPTGVELYLKHFDLNGNIIDGMIAITYPNRIMKDTLNKGEKFRLGFSLQHSIYKTPRLHMYLIDKMNLPSDTISMGSDTSFLEYDIKIKEGLNKYQVDLFELDGKSDIVRGFQTMELKYIGE